MSAIYNEVDPVACAVLRHLSNENIIAPGLVVERSIKDIHDLDLIGVVQFHAFAGAGLWSIAARLAGWPDDRPLWSGSCPCQGWSTAGKRKGFEDSRDIWPDFFRLVAACRPPVVVGEITSGSAIYPWFDRTASDLESVGYACRAVDLPACAVDAPHRRNRLWWVALADADSQPRQQVARSSSCDETANGRTRWNERQSNGDHRSSGDDESRMANTDGGGHRGRQEDPQRVTQRRDAVEWPDGDLGFSPGHGRQQRENAATSTRYGGLVASTDRSDLGDASGAGLAQRSIADDQRRTLWDEGTPIGPTAHRSFWMDAEWLACADGKARRAKRELCGVVDGLARESDSGDDTGYHSAQVDYSLLVKGQIGRADLWRLVGNSIVPQLAAEVLRALKDEIDSRG